MRCKQGLILGQAIQIEFQILRHRFSNYHIFACKL